VAAGLDPEFVQELFAAFGAVSVRRMFGGAGIWADGVMIGLVHDGVIFLKTAPDGTDAFAREGSTPFSYTKKGGEHRLTSYWRLPERLYDDTDELAAWARTSLAVAQAKQAGKKRPAARAKKSRRAR
jgi:DNA transformation protein